MSNLDSILDSIVSEKQEEERRKQAEAEEKQRQKKLEEKRKQEEEQRIIEIAAYISEKASSASLKLNSVGALPPKNKLIDVSSALSDPQIKASNLLGSETYQFVGKIAKSLYQDCSELGYSGEYIRSACHLLSSQIPQSALTIAQSALTIAKSPFIKGPSLEELFNTAIYNYIVKNWRSMDDGIIVDDEDDE
jgi:hypothetical protein